MDETPKPPFLIRRRAWLIAAVAAALLAAAWVWLPGAGLRYGLIRGLHGLGWDQVSVLRADVSLFNGAIVINRVQAGGSSESVLGVDGLDLTFHWKPLFSRRIAVERLDLEGVNVDARREGDTFVINGLPLAPSGGDPEDSPAWGYGVTALSLANSRIALSDGAFKADILVDSLVIENLKSWEPDTPSPFRLTGRLNGAPLTLEGTATPFAARPEFSLALTVGALDATTLDDLLRRAGAGRLSGTLDAAVTIAGAADAKAPLSVGGRLALTKGAWALGTTKVMAAALQAEDLRLTLTPGRLDSQGTVAGTDIRVEDGGVAVTAAQARLQVRGASHDFRTAKLSWDGALHAERHAIAVDDTALEHATLDWDGVTTLDLAAGAQSFVHAQGKARAAGIRIHSGAVTLQAKAAAAEGVFEHARPNGMLPPLAGHMDAWAEQLVVSEGDMDWMRAERLDLGGLVLNPGKQASLARAEARDLAALSKRGEGAYSWRFRAAKAMVEQASMAADGAGSAQSLILDSAVIRVTQTKDGILGLPQQGGSGGATATPMPRQALAHLRLGGDSRIDFIDRTRSEPVRVRLEAIEATVDGLDTARPDQASRFSASARVGAAQLSAKGEALPFATAPGGALKGSVRALDLPPLSPYAADALGVNLHTGLLDADFDLSATMGKLDGGMQLTLSELFVSQPDPNAPLAKKADMPVETVLDLLRDSDNRIRLSIPVRGDLSNPDFDVSDAVGQAVGGALKTTVFTTLKVAFPLAGLISLVIDGSEASRLALEPLAFHPGDSALGDAERRKLDEVARLMKQRSSLKLTLCGAASEQADWPVLLEKRRASLLERLQTLVGNQAAEGDEPNRDRLSRLAETRAQAAKSYLAEKAGIDPGRLFTCRPRVDSETGATPRVDMLL